MAMVPFLNYTSDIAPHVSGCPTAIIAQYIRKVFIDLCERGKVWRVPLANVTLASGVSTYTLVSPIADTEVSALLNVQYYTSTTPSIIRNLETGTAEAVMSVYPDWPNTANPGEPRVLFQSTPDSFSIAPVPAATPTFTLKLTAAVKPIHTATTGESTLIETFRKVIFHGVLQELYLLPGRVWTNDKLAVYHGKEYNFYLTKAKAKANKGFGRTSISIQHRPWA